MSQRKSEPWRGNNERHYCQVCNSWMGGDRQSILIHENGKKHKENLEKSFEAKREQKTEQDKAQRLLEQSLKQMNQAAASAHMRDVGQYGNTGFEQLMATTTMSFAAGTGTAPPPPPTQQVSSSDKVVKKDLKAWQSRKKKREQDKNKDKKDDESSQPQAKKPRRKLRDDEGYYTHGEVTYLEGPSFVELLEEDIPIEIWTGPVSAGLAEKKLPEKHHHWQKGLVIQVRNSSKDDTGKVLDVSYLESAQDAEETLEKSVSPARIRIILGSDEHLPDTLDEARLAVMGEEVIQVETTQQTLNENTGLSGWGTVEIRKTTVKREEQEERERMRAQRREAQERLEKERKDAEGRRMEEAKVENAEDSALGAYDVWSSGKAGYKGVDISKQSKLTAHDTAKSLAQGTQVAFKKKKAVKKKKQNRRTTSADDD